MRSASTPPIRKKNSAAAPYMIPIFLWSIVLTQLRHPVLVRGRVKSPSGFATVDSPGGRARGPLSGVVRASWRRLIQGAPVADEQIDLVVGQLQVRHPAGDRASRYSIRRRRLAGRWVAQPRLQVGPAQALLAVLLGVRPVHPER